MSGTIFIAGAIGFEVIAGLNYFFQGHTDTIGYALIVTVEELLEMLGMALFIYSLLLYITTEFKALTITAKLSK